MPEIYFPRFPAPKDGVIIPLDINNQKVTDAETEIYYILMPYWYWNLLIDYKCENDVAASVYNAAKKKLTD